MANDVILNPAAGGDTIAADALGGTVKHQQVLTEFGAAGTATRVDVTHPLPTQMGRSAGKTLSTVNCSLTSQQFLASNANRSGVIAHNNSGGNAFVKYGTTASLTDYTIPIGPGDVWVMDEPIETGRLDVISDLGSGVIYITEQTN